MGPPRLLLGEEIHHFRNGDILLMAITIFMFTDFWVDLSVLLLLLLLLFCCFAFFVRGNFI